MKTRNTLTQGDIAAALQRAGSDYALVVGAEVDPMTVLGRETYAGMGRLAVDARRVLKGLHAVQEHDQSLIIKRQIAATMAIHRLPKPTDAFELFHRFDDLVDELEHLAAACDELAKVSKFKLGTGLQLLIQALVIALHEQTGRLPTLTDVRACLDVAALSRDRFHPHFTQAQGADSAVKVAFELVRSELGAALK